MGRCLIAVFWTLVAGCNFHVNALPLDNGGATADLATASGVVDLATPPAGAGDLAMPSSLADLAAAPDLTTPGGLLMGTRDPIPGGVIDLTLEGQLDWAHWGLGVASDVDHKSGVTPLIAMTTTVAPNQYGQYMPKLKWSDGTPTAKTNNTSSGVFVNGLNSSFTFTVPADATTRTLRLYLTNFNSTGKLVAHLSDGSAPDYAQTLQAGGNLYYRVTLTYHALGPGQTLEVTWTLQADAGNGSVDALAATLY